MEQFLYYMIQLLQWLVCIVILASVFAPKIQMVFADGNKKNKTKICIALVVVLFGAYMEFLLSEHVTEKLLQLQQAKLDWSQRLLFVSFQALINVCVLFLTTIFLMWALYKERMVWKNLISILIFTLVQLLFLLDCRYILSVRYELHTKGFWGIVVGLLASMLNFQMILRLQKVEKLNESIFDLEKKMQIDQDYAKEVADRRKELEQLQSMFENRLQEAYKLIEQSDEEEARERLEILQEYVEQTKEYQYSGNKIIDAVVTEKEKEARSRNIEFEVNINVSKELNVTPVSLCSIFSNLLDNAIKGTEHAKKPYIEVMATQTKGYFVIKVKNSMNNLVSKKRTDRKSYGQKILRDIAQRYQGTFSTEAKDGVYSAVMVILDEAR